MRQIVIYMLLFFIPAVAFSYVEISQKEKNALIDLFNSTNGTDWSTPWDLNASVSTWKGVKLKDGHVVGLNLFRNNLEGTLPESIGRLRYLTHLNLAFNSITGVCLRIS